MPEVPRRKPCHATQIGCCCWESPWWHRVVVAESARMTSLRELLVRLANWLDDARRDVQYAARTLLRSPGFTVVAVTKLALGIGVNAAVFTVTNATLFKGFPLVHRNDRLLYMTTGRGCCVSYPDFEDWRAQARSFERMAIVHGAPLRSCATGFGNGGLEEIRTSSAGRFGPGSIRIVSSVSFRARSAANDDARGVAQAIGSRLHECVDVTSRDGECARCARPLPCHH